MEKKKQKDRGMKFAIIIMALVILVLGVLIKCGII